MQRQKGGAWQRNEYVVTYIIETLGFLAWRRRGRNMLGLTTSYGHATSQPGRYKLRYKAHVTNAGTNSRTDGCVYRTYRQPDCTQAGAMYSEMVDYSLAWRAETVLAHEATRRCEQTCSPHGTVS